MNFADVWGIKIINTCPHPIRFMREKDCADILVPPCGIVVNAKTERVEIKRGKLIFVVTIHHPNSKGLKFLRNLPLKEDKALVVIGSEIASIAYPGKIKALIPCTSHARRPKQHRAYRHDRFKIIVIREVS